MPPKKRQRVSQAASPEASLPPDTPAQANAAADPKEENQDDEGRKGNATVEERELAELWTDSEEIGLFKGIMRWKPTGIHKHFRILALHNWLLQNNHITPGQRHTSPAGIRAKLKTLYDLEALDAREDARQLSKMVNPLLTEEDKAELSSSDDDDSHAYSEAANKIETSVFALPKDEDFARLMWRQRFADPTKDEEEDVATGIEGGDEAQHQQQQKKRRGGGAHNGGRRTRKSTSPLGLAELNLADDPPIIFTPSFSVEPSDAPTPAPKPSGRGGRGGSGRGRGRGGSRAAAAAASGPKRRSTRQAESNADEASSRGDKEDDNEEDEVEDGGEEDEGGEDDDEEGDGEEGEEDGDGAEGDEDDGEDNEDDEDDDDENQSQTSTPVPRSTRSSRSKRGRGTASSSAAASRRTRKRQR